MNAARRTLTQRPSSHRFDWRKGELEAAAVSESPFNPLLARSISDALREKATYLLAVLTRNHADAVVGRDIQRALDLLASPIETIAEGVLLMRANAVTAHARAYADAGNDRERSIRAALDDFATSLGNLVDCYPGVRRISANRLELDIQAGNALAIAAEMDEIAGIASASPVVAPSAMQAFNVGREEISSFTDKISRATGSVRASYIEARAQLVAARLLDLTNLVSAAAQRPARKP